MQSLKTRLISSFLLIIVILTCVELIFVFAMLSTMKRYKDVNDNMIREYELIEASSNLIEEYNGYIKNSTQKDRYEASKSEINNIFSILDKTMVHNDSRVIYEGLKNTIGNIISECDKGIQEAASGNFSNIGLYYDEANRIFYFVKENTGGLILKELEYTKLIQKNIDNFLFIVEVGGGLVIVATSIVCILYAYSFSRRLILPLSVLTQLAQKVAEGDLNIIVDKKLQDVNNEIGSLARSFAAMVDALRENIQKITDSNVQLAKAKDEMDIQNSELERASKASQEAKSAVLNLLEDAKALEVDLRKERDRAQAIISSMGEGLLVIGTNYKITLINKAAQTMLGVTEKEVLGADWSSIVDVFHGETKATLSYRSFYRALNEKQTFVTGVADGHYYHTKSGKIFPVASITSPLFSGSEVIGAIKVFRDVTNEKEEKTRIENIVDQRTKELREKNLALQKAQEQVTQGWMALQDEKARLTASINSLSLGFILTDNSDSILIMNPAASVIFNNKGNFTKFSEIETLLKLSDASSLLKEKRLVELKEVNFENKILRILMASITSSAKGQEEVIGNAIVVEDITESKVLERSKDEFFSIASHELRTPLTSIRGNTSMILDYFLQEFKDPNLKEMIQDIHESSIRLIGIVNDFLDLSRLEQKRMEFKKENVDLIDLSKEVLSELKANTNGKVELKLLLPNYSKVHVFADKNKTKEIVINLVGNVLKFTDSGSVSVRFEIKENMVETFIVDTGRGIPVANQNLLFRKFQQAGDSLFTRDTTKGTGLGLYISKLMVEGMGGVIRLVESTAGKGTTFSFTLPKADD